METEYCDYVNVIKLVIRVTIITVKSRPYENMTEQKQLYITRHCVFIGAFSIKQRTPSALEPSEHLPFKTNKSSFMVAYSSILPYYSILFLLYVMHINYHSKVWKTFFF